MKRRSIVAAATASWLLLPLPRARAQAPARQRPARIGWPGTTPSARGPLYAAFTEAMRERGWIEGTHYVVEQAGYDGRSERIAEAVAEVVKRNPDLLIGNGSPTMRALTQATSTIPIDVAQVRAGILVSYGWKIEDMVRRLPHYVIRILEGTPPADLPVEQPTRFYVGLNLKTARALGLTLPQSLLLRADEVIQ